MEIEADQARYRKSKIVIKGVAIAAGSIIAIGAIGNVAYRVAGKYVSSGFLTSLDDLRASGTCADEFHAEAQYLRFKAKLTNGDKEILKQVQGFERAEKLAKTNNVPCIKRKAAKKESLTPDFDVAQLIENGDCASELRSERIPIDSDPKIEKQNELDRLFIHLNEQLAEKFSVSC